MSYSMDAHISMGYPTDDIDMTYAAMGLLTAGVDTSGASFTNLFLTLTQVRGMRNSQQHFSSVVDVGLT